MTRGVRARLLAFLVLSAVGIVYVAANYLGLVDKLAGRGLTLHADLPTSGGLFVGSEVTYRGVKVGQVSRMTVIPAGVHLTLALEEGTRIPQGSPFYVHNLSAVGEQYLDFEPADGGGPMAADGATFTGGQDSLPQSTDDLLVKVDALVSSLDRNDLSTVSTELGATFRDAADPLRKMVDAGSQLIARAQDNEDETISLIESGRTVLESQQANAANIRTFSANLAGFARTWASSDQHLRTLLAEGTPAAQEVNGLLSDLAPVLPGFLAGLVTVNQVATDRLDALEQVLVTFPPVIATGFTGTPGDGYGHINLQFNYGVPACTAGYQPPSQWRPGTDLADTDPVPVQCLSNDRNFRGSKWAPTPSSVLGNRNRTGTYDAAQGPVDVDLANGRHTVFGDNSWRLMLPGSDG